MDLWDFKKWRRKLKYSQFEAAEELGLSRAAVQNWESETVPISEVRRNRPKKGQFGSGICVLPKFLACPLRGTNFNVAMTIGVVGWRLDVTSCVVLPGAGMSA